MEFNFLKGTKVNKRETLLFATIISLEINIKNNKNIHKLTQILFFSGLSHTPLSFLPKILGSIISFLLY